MRLDDCVAARAKRVREGEQMREFGDLIGDNPKSNLRLWHFLPLLGTPLYLIDSAGIQGLRLLLNKDYSLLKLVNPAEFFSNLAVLRAAQAVIGTGTGLAYLLF